MLAFFNLRKLSDCRDRRNIEIPTGGTNEGSADLPSAETLLVSYLHIFIYFRQKIRASFWYFASTGDIGSFLPNFFFDYVCKK